MKFDPQTFIDVCNTLEPGKNEAHNRTIINRAYYGAFGHIRNRLGVNISQGSVHREVINTLIRSRSITRKKAGKRLERLFKKRKEADYDHRFEIRQHNSEFSINEAQDIIKLFDDDNS